MAKLIESIGPETSAILWITKSTLKDQNSSDIFFELDYLFDGLLSKYCQSSKDNNNKAFFSTPSFNKTLFLGHICSENSSFNGDFLDTLDLMNKNNSENKFIIRVISDIKIDQKLLDKSKKKHQNINFFSFSK